MADQSAYQKLLSLISDKKSQDDSIEPTGSPIDLIAGAGGAALGRGLVKSLASKTIPAATESAQIAAYRKMINPELYELQTSGKVAPKLAQQIQKLEEIPEQASSNWYKDYLKKKIAQEQRVPLDPKLASEPTSIIDQTKVAAVLPPILNKPEEKQKFPSIKKIVKSDNAVDKQDQLLQLMSTGTEEEKQKAAEEMMKLMGDVSGGKYESQ